MTHLSGPGDDRSSPRQHEAAQPTWDRQGQLPPTASSPAGPQPGGYEAQPHAHNVRGYPQGPPGYYQGPPGYYQGPPGFYQGGVPALVRPTSSWAVAGFICSVLWGFGFLSFVGLFLSGHAWRTETGSGLKGGHGLAVAGVILGAVGSIPAVLLVIGYFSLLLQGG